METPINMKALTGELIAGRYRLEKYLDEGAFGAVYKASHEAYGVELRKVAIKLAKRPMTSSEARKAFADALHIVRMTDLAPDISLKQHFVTVHDAGQCPDGSPLAGHPYMVMELISGGSIEKFLKIGPFPLTRAINYFDQMLKAVAFMHYGVTKIVETQQPMLHRDIKPANFLVVRSKEGDDIVKITDFGLAIEVDQMMGWINSGGDLAYLAPESFSHGICSPQTDVYMLGLVFYQMLTGKNPFSIIGTHLRGSDENKRKELNEIHFSARKHERFSLLENNEEIKQRPAIARVIRNALQLEMIERPYNNAYEMLMAWEKAKAGDDASRSINKSPWETARLLYERAIACRAKNDWQHYELFLKQASDINRDKTQVPDAFIVGEIYLEMVKFLLDHNENMEAAKIAGEGYRRRKSKYTCRAMAEYYKHLQSPVAVTFEKEALTFEQNKSKNSAY